MKRTSLWHFLATSTILQIAFLLLTTHSSLAQTSSCTGSPVVCTISPASNPNIPSNVVPNLVQSEPAGTKFVFNAGTYRLTIPIQPLTGDTFDASTQCHPSPTSGTPCSVIISGSECISLTSGSGCALATLDNTTGYYEAPRPNQSNPQGNPNNCLSGWLCNLPEDLYFNGVPQKEVSCTSISTCTLSAGEWWLDYTNHVVWFHDNPSGIVVENSVVPYAFGGTANNVTIQDLTIEEFADMYPNGAISVFQGANALTQGTNWKIQRCEVTLNHGYGIRSAYKEQILNDYIHLNGQLGVGGGISLTAAGTVNTNGTAVTWESGTAFSTSWTGSFYIGTPPNVVTYTLSSCGSTTSCTLATSAGTQTGVPYTFVLIPQSTDAQILIETNYIDNNNGTQSTNTIYAGFNPGFGAGGIKFGSVTGATIRGNAISGNLGSAVHFDVQSGSNTVENNSITNNTDGSAVVQEISFGPSTWRNNIVTGNGDPVNTPTEAPYYAMESATSTGVDAYCNVMEIPAIAKVHGWVVGSSSTRGYSGFPPFGPLVSTGNNFHNNTVIWDPGATGTVGFIDDGGQSDFFTNNTPPDFNTYHLPNVLDQDFIYDNNTSGINKLLVFSKSQPPPTFQGNGADVDGTADASNTSGYPHMTITSPASGSSFSSMTGTTLKATATDTHTGGGIQQVQFFRDFTNPPTLLGTGTLSNGVYSLSGVTFTGTHTVTAVGLSKEGIQACYGITLTGN